MSDQHSTVSIPLLASWSVTTTAYEKHEYRNRNPYIDSTRNKGEGMNVAASRKAAELRKSHEAMERTVAKLEALEDAPTYTPRDAQADILASGLPYHTVSIIIRALNGNVTPQTVRDGIAAYKSKLAARKSYNEAFLARIQAQAV